MSDQTIQAALYDDLSGAELKAEIQVRNGKIWIAVKGYGEQSAEDGYGTPIGIEVYAGHLRVLAWHDINQSDPYIIDMEGAREERLTDG